MSRLKRIITIALLVSMLPRTAMAEGEGTKGDTGVSKCQRTNTTESKQGEESTDVSGRQKAIATETK